MSERESARAKDAWADYLSLGPDRSLEKLIWEYQSRAGSAPTRQLSRLKVWSAHFDWQARLAKIAEDAAREASEREAAYRRSILEEGFGLAHERVGALKNLAGQLLGELADDGRLWVREPKMLGSGDSAELVHIERFNAAEVEQLRGLLDDIAKEKGERKEGRVDVLMQQIDLSQLTDEQLERIVNGDDPVKVLVGRPSSADPGAR